jgi:hypothetical protein
MSFLIPPSKGVPKSGRPSRAWILDNTFLLGDNRIPKSKDQGGLAISGGIGSGKTTVFRGFIRSNLKYIPDYFTTVNAVVYSPKNDLLPILRGMELPLEVISAHVLDPTGWRWRLDEDITDPIAAEQAVLDMLPDEREGNDNKFYSDAPRRITAAVMSELVRLNRGWTLRHVCLLSWSEWYAKQLIQRSLDARIRETLSLFDKDLGSTKANVHASLLTKLGNVATYAILMERCKHSYSIKELVRGDQVLVLGSDYRYSHILGPLNNLTINVMKRELLSQPESHTRRHYMFIDEFPKLNYNQPAEDFPDFLELGRSFGVRAGIVMQTPRQLVKLYGPEGASIIMGQSLNKLFLRHADLEGATDCSNLLGRINGREWNYNVGEGGSHTSAPGGDSSTRTWNDGASEVWADRPLVTPHDILNLPLASWTEGFSGFAICPALAQTKRWRFDIGPEWIKENIDPSEPISFPEPLSRDLKLEPLTRYEAERFGLEFDSNDHHS